MFVGDDGRGMPHLELVLENVNHVHVKFSKAVTNYATYRGEMM